MCKPHYDPTDCIVVEGVVNKYQEAFTGAPWRNGPGFNLEYRTSCLNCIAIGKASSGDRGMLAHADVCVQQANGTHVAPKTKCLHLR